MKYARVGAAPRDEGMNLPITPKALREAAVIVASADLREVRQLDELGSIRKNGRLGPLMRGDEMRISR